MGDDHHGHAGLCQLLHDGQNLADHFRIEGGGGFVKKHDLGVHGQRPDDGDTLLLAAGELVGIGVRLFFQTDPAQQLGGLVVRFCLRHQTGAHGGEGDVLADGHVGEEVEVLEHHAHFPTDHVDVRLWVGDDLAVKGDGAGGGFFQQVQTAQERGFAGAGGADDDHFVPGVNVFGNVLENQMVAEGFAQMLNVYHFDAASFPVNFAAS